MHINRTATVPLANILIAAALTAYELLESNLIVHSVKLMPFGVETRSMDLSNTASTVS